MLLFPNKFLLSCACLPLSLAMNCLAFAQSASSNQNDEVIVTATKTLKPPQDLGMSISVLNGRKLSTFDGAEELSQEIAGLQAAVANGNQVAFQIRGIGAVDHQALTPTAAGVYIDNTFQATNVQTSPLLFDVARVEVLKGPQGSLYGRNSSSGTVNFISVLPSDDKEGYLSGEYGNFDRINLNAASTVPVSEVFSLRLAGRYLSQSSVIKNVPTNLSIAAPDKAGGERNEFGLRAIGLLKASSNTDVVFNLHYAEDNGINPSPLNDSLDLNNHEISIGPDGIRETDNEFIGGSVNVKHDSGTLSIVSHTAYEAYNQQYGFDFDGTPAPFDVSSLNSNLIYDRDFSQMSQELRISSNRRAIEWMAGLYLEAEDFNQEYLLFCGDLNPLTLLGTCRYVGAPGRVGPTPASTGIATSLQSLITQSRETAALFTYNTIEMTPELKIVFGGRLTYELIEGQGEGLHYFDDGIVALNNRDNLGLAQGGNTISDTNFTGNLGINYKPYENILLYVSYAAGYKSGGFNGEVINNATHFSNEGLFQAETVDSFELGLKSKWSQGVLNFAGFYQNYENPQARIFVPFDTGADASFTSNSLSNLDEAKSYGVEAEIRWSPIEGLDILTSGSWLKTKINQENDPLTPQNAFAFDGNPLPFASEFSGVLAVEYLWALTPSLSGLIKASGKYQSEFFLDAEGLDDRRQKAYGKMDASAAIIIQNNLELGVWSRNLTNSDYATSGFGFIGYNTFRGPPRRYGMSLRYSY